MKYAKKLLIIDHHPYKKDLNTKKISEKMGSELIEEAVDFIKSLSRSDRVALLYHRDGDGICSAFLIHKILDTLKIPILYRRACGSLVEYKANQIPDNITTIVSCDLPLDRKIDESKIDYCVHLNSRFLNIKNPFHYSATVLAYDIFDKFANLYEDLKSYDWALLGCLCDCKDESQHESIREVVASYTIEKARKFEDIITLCGRSFDANLVLEAMLFSRNLDEIIQGENLFSHVILKEYKAMAKIRSKIIKDVEESIKTERPIGNVKSIIVNQIQGNKKAILCELKSCRKFLSEVADEVSDGRKGDFICIFEFGEVGDLKFRCIGGEFKVNEIAAQIAKLFGGEGGGHREAAGAEIKADETSKQRIIEEILKLLESCRK